MPAPSQRTIKIPNRILKQGLEFDKISFEYAVQHLPPNAFKLWCYFHDYEQNKDLELSSTHFCIWANCSRDAYMNAFNTLKEKGFLQATTRKTYYIFVDYPLNYINKTIKLENETTAKKISLGEQRIAELLTFNKNKFIQEATFGTCLFEDTHYPARFDFLVDNTFLIEFDGEQHYKPVDMFGGQENFAKIQEHDIYKNQWCKENNIPLIRIPYTKLKTLAIEDLMLETTQFRVV